jgi:hypothetical protein
LDEILIQKVLEFRAAHFESHGICVRQIVGDVVNIHLLRNHAAACTIKSSDH